MIIRNADVRKTSSLLKFANRTLRFYGFTFRQFGVGFLVSRKERS